MYFPIGYHLSLLYRAQQTFLTNETDSCEIGGGQLSFVFCLYSNPGCSQEDVAHMLELDKTTVTRAVLKMEQNGIIERKRDQADRRVIRLYLTEKGVEIHKKLKNVVRDWFSILSDGMTEEETKELEKSMIKMSENAKKYKAQCFELKDK